MRRSNPKFDRNSKSDNSKSFDRKEGKGKPKSSDNKESRGKRKFDKPKSSENKSTRGKGKFERTKSFDGKGSIRKSNFDNPKSSDNKDSRGKGKYERTKSFEDKKDARKGKFDDRRGKRNFSNDNPRFKNFRRKRKANKVKEDDGLIRLNKYVANAGICSRRQADEYIKTGLVEVNGTVITEMGYKVKAEDDVRFDGKRISPEKKVYVLLNKPKGFITTTNDERGRKTVMDLVANATTSRLFPVGRLDRQTTGVLLFTNDGHLAKKLTHPSHNIRKIYHVVLDKDLHGDDMEKIRQGIHMQEGIAKVDKISFIEGKPHREIGIELHIGWNRVVRRIFEKLGYKVEHLDRVQFAGLTKKNLKRGHWRKLDGKEVNFLKMM